MVEPTPLFDQDFEERVSQAASTRAVEGLDYDQKESARAMQLQRLFGVPAPLIAGDLEGFEREQKTKLVSNMVRSNPAIQDYLNGNPLAARISQDDYPQLDTWHQSMREFVRPPALFDRIESGLKKVGQSFVEGLVSAPLKAGAIVPRQIAEARKEGQDQFAPQELPEDATPEERAAFRLRRGQLHQTEQVREERKQAFNEATSKPVEEHPLYKAGQFVEDVAKYLMPEDPRFQDEFLASKVPGALGSIASFIVGGGILATTKAPMAFTTATLGSVQQSVSQFEDAIQHGASIEDALKTAGYGAAIGTSEALPIVHFLERLDKTTGGTLKKAIGRILLQGTEEFTQEFGQKVAENLTANKFVGYDPERGTFTGAMDDASVGFTAGAIMETMAQIIGGKRAKVSAQSVASRIKTANAYLAAGETPPVGLDPFFDLQHAEQAKSDLALFNDLMSQANKTQTKELSPELAEQFAKQGVGEFKIGIPPEAVLELYGTKQPSADDGLLGFISDLNDQLEIAAQTGGDVQVSLAQLLAHGDSEVIDKIEEHLRIREGGMTAKEAEEFKEQQDAQTKEEVVEPQGPSSVEDLARREAGFDTYASRVRQQVMLKKVDEEIDEDHPNDPPHSVYHILNDQGQKIGDATVQLTAKNMLYVSWIGGYKPNPSYKDVARGTPQVFGLHATMSLFEQLAKEYPTATHIGGYRATGAREKADATGWAQMSLDTFRKDPQKGAEFLASFQDIEELPEDWADDIKQVPIGWDKVEPTPPESDLPGTVTTDLPGGGMIKWQPQPLWDSKKAEVWQAISDIAEQIAPGVNLILGDKVTTKATGFDTEQEVHGFFSKGQNAEPYIVLAYNPKIVGTLLHEAIHHLRRGGFFTEGEWGVLEQAAEDDGWIEKHNIDHRYPIASEAMMLEESIAEEYKTWVQESAQTKGKSASEVAKVFAKLKKFFDQIKIRLQEIFGSDITFQRLFTQVSAGEIGSRQGDKTFAQSAPQAQAVKQVTSPDQELGQALLQVPAIRQLYDTLSGEEQDAVGEFMQAIRAAATKREMSPDAELRQNETQDERSLEGGLLTTAWIEADQAVQRALDEIPNIERVAQSNPQLAQAIQSIQQVAKARGLHGKPQILAMVMQATQDEEQQMFERGSALGMTQDIFNRWYKAYSADKARLEDLARRKAEAKADLRKTQEWKEYLPKAREQAETEVYNSPAIRVDEYFRSGKIDGAEVDKIRLGKEFLTREQQEALGANIYSKDGVDPNDVSWLFGFLYGPAMIHAMASVRSERTKSGLSIAAFKERLVADRQQEIMKEKFLGPKMEEELKDAREDVISSSMMDQLYEELLGAMLLAKQFDPKIGAPFSKDDVKKAAKAAFQNIPIKRALKMEQYLKEAGKAGNAALAAVYKNNHGEVLRQKQRQILNAFFAAESKALIKAQAQLESVANRFKPREVKSVDHATTVFVKRLLNKAGFRVNRSEEELDQGMDDHGFASLDTFVQHMRGDGWEITIPDYLVREEVKPADQMTVEELYDFKDAVTSMATAGKGIRTILSAGEAKDFDDYKEEVLRRVKSRPMRDVKVPERRAYTWDAMLARMEEIVKDLDGRDEPNGPLYNVLIRGTSEAKHTEYSLQEKLVEKLNAIKGFAKGWRGSLKETIQNNLLIDPRTGAPFDLTRGDLIGIMLNFGSESNIEKFTAGFIDRSAIPGESRKDRSKRLKADAQALGQQLEHMIDQNATKEDRDFAQAIWDIFHDWQPMINDMYTELSGIGPKFIAPRKVQSQHGSYKGGYFPILWDKMRSNINVVEEENTSLNKLFSGNYFKATVANHYTKTRTDAVDVVAFSNITEQLGQRMQQVIHDLSYRRAIMEVNKVIYDKEIRAAIRDHYGKEYADQLEPWVKDIANHFNSNERAIEGLNWALRAMRFNTIAHVLPFNIKTILSPSVGLMNPAAIMRTLFRPQESTAEAWAKSQEIPHTFRNMNRDMREKMDTLIESHGWDSFVAEAVRWGFQPIVKLEQAFRITTFLDAYKKAIAEGKNEGDAVTIGDSAVRTYHGAHGLPDLPAIMRSSEAAKVFTMFYGYFSTMHNWRRQVPDAVRRGDWDTMMTVAWGTTLLPALFSMALYNKYDGDDEDKLFFRWVRNFIKAVGLETSGGIPGVREAANYWLEWQEPKTALEGLVKAVAITGRDIKRFAEGKDVKAPIQHTMNTIGLATGLPMGQIGRTAQGIRDVQTGSQDRPRNIWQWFNLITHGRVEDKKRR